MPLCSPPSVSQSVFTITEKAPTRAFSCLKAPTSAFTFKTLLRHYAKRALTHEVDVKLGNYHKGWAAIRHYANQPFMSTYHGVNAYLAYVLIVS